MKNLTSFIECVHLDDKERRQKVAICRGGEDDAAGGRVHAVMSKHSTMSPLRHLAPVDAQLVHSAHLVSGELLLSLELGQNRAKCSNSIF